MFTANCHLTPMTASASKRPRRPARAVRYLGLALFLAALATEFNKPPEVRTWHGWVFGLVPYEFRPPTPRRIQERWWNPDDTRIFTEHVFGIGWSINLREVVRIVSSK